ncbi:MAG: hypothetical protein K5695_04830 [Oscillospiraceae bacterium]|nr:hypothetical protein [Oscillospiraceae bacterium]
MAQEHDWQYDLDEYIRQGEPDRSEKSAAWQTAIGLQDVDGLRTSEYLLETAKEHIEGKIDIAAAQKRIYGYYEQRDVRMTAEKDTKEADIVASRIAELLAENSRLAGERFVASQKRQAERSKGNPCGNIVNQRVCGEPKTREDIMILKWKAAWYCTAI